MGNSNCPILFRELPDGARQQGKYSELALKLRMQKVDRLSSVRRIPTVSGEKHVSADESMPYGMK